MNEIQPLTVFVKSSIFDRPRKLVIAADYIEFDDNDVVGGDPTIFNCHEITGLRFGTRWIRGYSFYVGRVYCIDIRSSSNKLIRIRLRSIYRIGVKALTDKYQSIVAALQKNFLNNMVEDCFNRFEKETYLELNGLVLTPSGITFGKTGDLIEWTDIGVSKYIEYFSIYAKSAPTKFVIFEYLSEWNAWVLYLVCKRIRSIKIAEYN